jgi:hypothetical protein
MKLPTSALPAQTALPAWKEAVKESHEVDAYIPAGTPRGLNIQQSYPDCKGANCI